MHHFRPATILVAAFTLAMALPRPRPLEAGAVDVVEAGAKETAARKTYEATLAAFQAGTADVEAVYLWSIRWMNAERAPSKENHLARMEALHKHVATLHHQSRRGGEAERFHATQYYAAEARDWVAER